MTEGRDSRLEVFTERLRVLEHDLAVARKEIRAAEAAASDALHDVAAVQGRDEANDAATRRDLAAMRDKIAMIEATHIQDASALATDLSTLASDATQHRHQQRRQHQGLTEQIEQCLREVSEATATAERARLAAEEGISSLADEIRVGLHESSERCRSRIGAIASEAGTQIDIVKRAVEDTAKAAELPYRNLEALVKRALVEHERESRRRFDTLSSAVTEICKKLSIAAPPL